MGQYLHETYAIGSTPTLIQTDPIRTNLAARETAGVACTVKYTGRDGTGRQEIDPYGFLFVEGVHIEQLRLEGNGATLRIDLSSPEKIDPKYLGPPVTGSVTNVNITGNSGGNLAQETGGMLAAIKAQTDKLTFHTGNALFTTTV